MKIEKPKFTLKEACPVCGQGGLLFLTCPTCGTTILACDEEGSVFPNPKDLSQQESWPCDPWVSTVTKCPHCGKEGESLSPPEKRFRNWGSPKISTNKVV